MSKVVEAALDMLKADKCIFQVLDTVGAAAVSLTDGDLSVDSTLELLKVLRMAEQRIQEITGSRL